MKRNIGGLLVAIGMVATWTGCGGKESTPPAPAPANNVASAPVAGAVAPPVSSSEVSAPQTPPAASQPSRPTFGSAGAPANPDSNSTAAPAASDRPQFSVGGASPAATPTAATPTAAGQGGPQLLGAGGSGTLPQAGNLAGASNSPASSTPNDNPFDDPSNLLAPTIELSLQDRAINAFKVGNVTRAYGLYQGHLLSIPSDELEGAMQNMRWDKKRVVPRLGYSFAVGLIVNNPGKVASLKPIGTALDDLKGSASGSSGSPGRPGFGGPGGPGFGTPGGSSTTSIPTLPAKELSDAAGKFASTFVSSFNQAHSDGKWSEAFREYEFGSSLNMPTTSGGIASGFAGGLGAAGPSGGGPVAGGGPPAGYGGAGGPPAGYGGGQGGPPAGYGGGQGGPPAGYSGGGGPPAGYSGGPGSGAPPGYGGGAQGGPPAGYQGGPGAGAPPGYGGAQGGPPAGYSGGPNAGAPPGYGAPGGAAPGGAAPGGGQPPKPGQGGSGSNSGFEYIAPQDDAIGASGPSTTQASPSAASPSAGRPGFGGAGFGGPSAPPPATLDPAIAKDLQIPSGTIPLGAGLNYIGKGENVGELTKKAVEQGYDALIVFEVDVSLVRVNGTIKNDCRIRAVSLKGELDAKERSITSSLLNNRDVAADKDPDTRVGTAVDNFMKKMFEAYPMDDLPNFKAESIQSRRLKDLVNDKVRSKLDLLCEVELYASRGLIDNTLKEAAFERIAGSDGKILATSEPEDRIEILEKMIRRQLD